MSFVRVNMEICWLAAAREERDDTRAQLDAANEQLEAIGSQFSSMINEEL